MRKRSVLAAVVVGAALLASPVAAPGVGDATVERSERAAFRGAAFAAGLEHPWGAAFLPDGRLLVTERPGRMRVVDHEGRVSPPLGGVPEVTAGGWEGGRLGRRPARRRARAR